MAGRLKDHKAIRRLLIVPERYIEMLFTLTLLSFVGVLIWTSLDYGRFGKLIPLIVGVPTFAFLSITFLGQASTRFGRFLDRYKLDDVLDMSSSVSEFDGDSDETQSLSEKRLRMVVISGWILILTALFVNVGTKEGIAVFLLGYYRFQAGLSIPKTIGLSAVIWGFIYGVFVMMLGMPL